MDCPGCDYQLLPEARFCMNCGLQLRAGTPDQAVAVTRAAHATATLSRRHVYPANLFFRWLAYIVDSTLLVLLMVVSIAFVAATEGRPRTFEVFIDIAPRLSVYSVVVSAVYFIGFESSSLQGTPGKLLFGMGVADEDGERLGLLHAGGRYLFKTLFGFWLAFGLLLALFSAKKQTLHDMIAGTLVIER